MEGKMFSGTPYHEGYTRNDIADSSTSCGPQSNSPTLLNFSLNDYATSEAHPLLADEAVVDMTYAATRNEFLEKQKPKSMTFYCILLAYITVYCMHPLLIDALKFHGAATPSTSLFLLPHYFAMICAGFVAPSANIWNYKLTWSTWKKGFYLGFIDVLHQLFEKAGLMYAGSAVYILISNSSIIWTALFSMIMLKSVLTGFQWTSLFLICLGLGVKASGIDFELGNKDTLGVLLTLISALLHALTTVTNEKLLTSSHAIPGSILAFMMGVFNCFLLSIWFCIWTLPRWDELVVQNIIKHNGSLPTIGILMFGLFLCGLVNALTMWRLVQEIGAISLGVAKGFKAGAVFLLSHFFFCHLQESQCLSPLKALSAFICITGVIAYSLSTASKSKSERLKNC